ncbi:hypothetical protein BA917_09090 [Helicobacter pullorum]|uniref:hypothetical protein n=1 Tax=Helicobacter pullorum TaxID=35818 RepID=UPI000816A2F9|nr:hypothetical protein [Helicobacter pullorum]OCR18214.1 hypothetical protein BA917_09090 [Helicobacter pullorum]
MKHTRFMTFSFHRDEYKHLKKLAKENKQSLSNLLKSVLLDGKYHHISSKKNLTKKELFLLHLTDEEYDYLVELFKMISPMPRSKYIYAKIANIKNYHSVEFRSNVSYDIGKLKESLELGNKLKSIKEAEEEAQKEYLVRMIEKNQKRIENKEKELEYLNEYISVIKNEGGNKLKQAREKRNFLKSGLKQDINKLIQRQNHLRQIESKVVNRQK